MFVGSAAFRRHRRLEEKEPQNNKKAGPAECVFPPDRQKEDAAGKCLTGSTNPTNQVSA